MDLPLQLPSLLSLGRVAHLGREFLRELLEFLQVLAYLDFAVLVEQHAEQRLRAARVLDRLRSEEDVIRGLVVEGPILGRVRASLARRIFEEEYDAVDLSQTLELVRIERDELLELHVLDAELLDEVREDALWSVNA